MNNIGEAKDTSNPVIERDFFSGLTRRPISRQRSNRICRFCPKACRVDTQNAQDAVFLSTRQISPIVPLPAQAGLYEGRFFDGNFANCQNFTIFDS